MLLINATIATLTERDGLGLIRDGAVSFKGDTIDWVGFSNDVPKHYKATMVHDLKGRLLTPGLIDCHSHVVFGGSRAVEFEKRLKGASYEEIAKAGGGIVSTVKATREASEGYLLNDALTRIDAMIDEGVTLIEIKSGYGLDLETELKMLRVAKAIKAKRPINIRTSFLGAHAVPPEYKGRADAYIDEICIPTLREANSAGLVDAVDGFCEGVAFDVEQIDRLFKVAQELGIPVKLHAEQLSNIGGAKLAAQYKAISADHLEYANDTDVRALAQSGTVAVILPGAFYTLRENQQPPIDLFREYKVPMALATDCNPGSSPLTSPLLAMNMGCTLFRMTPEETLAGMTRNAAHALGLKDCGKIAVGRRADLAIWDVEHPAELSYRIGFNPLHKRVFGGQF